MAAVFAARDPNADDETDGELGDEVSPSLRLENSESAMEGAFPQVGTYVLVGWLVGWLVVGCWLIGRLIGRLSGWSGGLMID